MKIAFWNRYSSLNSRLFTDPNAPIGDNLLLPFNVLAQTARERGIEVGILEYGKRMDAIVFIDYPTSGLGLEALRECVCPSYLIMFEPPTVLPENWQGHAAFRKIFTWADSLVAVDPDRFVKIHYPQRFPEKTPRGPRSRLCCMIASNKDSDHPLSLYGERKSAIRWFEDHASMDLDLYGPGWTSGTWVGTIAPGRKVETLARYQFSIVFENARGIPGYITEKIFDCFAAGTIPIYLGASNITDYIPRTCFIDARGMSYLDIYRKMKTITFAEYAFRLDAIERFMQSESARPFTIERFVDTVLTTISG